MQLNALSDTLTHSPSYIVVSASLDRHPTDTMKLILVCLAVAAAQRNYTTLKSTSCIYDEAVSKQGIGKCSNQPRSIHSLTCACHFQHLEPIHKIPLPFSTKGSSKTCRNASKQFLPIQKLLHTHGLTPLSIMRVQNGLLGATPELTANSPKLPKYW
jgi:hypothetical protein